MLLGYNTNGFAHHRFEDCLAILAEIGYGSVAITLDHHALNPFEPGWADALERTRKLLERYRLRSVIETGARFLLDPRRKHEPTLLSPAAEARAVRLAFLKRAVDSAAALASDAVSFWSGRLVEPLARPAALRRLADGCRELLDYAARHGVRLAFEPEPGMFIETFEQYGDLASQLVGESARQEGTGGPGPGIGPMPGPRPLVPNSPTGRLADWPTRQFGLTIDVGHVHCVESGPIAGHLERWKDQLFNVHLEDMRRGVHAHLMFGEGEIDFAPVLATLGRIGYRGGLHVELSRHSYDAVAAAQRAFDFLRGLTLRSEGAARRAEGEEQLGSR